MKLKIRPIEIDKDNPFSNDALNRENNAVVLSELISSLDEPVVIAIDAPWGEGKTTFLKMFRQYLINNKFQTIYFNAWENDFTDDALAALIGEIDLGIKDLEIDKDSKSKIKDKIVKVKNLGSSLAKKSIPIALRVATAGLIDSEEIGNALAEITEDVAREQINIYGKAKKTLSSFKKSLSEFVKVLKKKNDLPLVFFIDELDRCRPNFAIEILEKAKHLFSVEGIVFVIAIDKKQIGHSISSIYGLNMSVDGYLRRFIDFDYRLPQPSHNEYAEYLFKRYEFDEYFSTRIADDKPYYASETIISMFSDLSKMLNLSLRVQEQCFSLLTIVLLTTPSNSRLYSHLLTFLLIIRMIEPDMYRRYVNNNSDVIEVIEYVKKLENGESFMNSNNGTVLEAYLITGRGDNNEINQHRLEYEEILKDEKSSDDLKQRAYRLVGTIREIDNENIPYLVQRISKKLEMLDRFTKTPEN